MPSNNHDFIRVAPASCRLSREPALSWSKGCPALAAASSATVVFLENDRDFITAGTPSA